MNDDELVEGLRARMGALPDVTIPQRRVWEGVRRRRRARLAVVGSGGVLAVALGAVAAIGAPWAPGPLREAAAPEPTAAASSTSTSTPSPTATSAMDCVVQPVDSAHEIVGWTQEKQWAIIPFLTKVDGVMQSDPGYQDIGGLYDPPGIQIWSSNPLPPALDPVIAEAEAAGLRIVLTQTRYGRVELEAAMTALREALAEAGIVVGYIAPGADFSALEVGGPMVSTDCATQARVLDIARAAVGDIPVKISADRVAGDKTLELE